MACRNHLPRSKAGNPGMGLAGCVSSLLCHNLGNTPQDTLPISLSALSFKLRQFFAMKAACDCNSDTPLHDVKNTSLNRDLDMKYEAVRSICIAVRPKAPWNAHLYADARLSIRISFRPGYSPVVESPFQARATHLWWKARSTIC